MCGFAGFMTPDGFALSEARKQLSNMLCQIQHRGPDAEGLWLEQDAGIALGHRRLSILDTTTSGNQPMTSPSGRYVIAFNGEIYNHPDLRRELQELDPQLEFGGTSDTETLLAGFDVWGITETLKRAVGMFAFAVWDKSGHALFLGRDRFGEKPLYWGWQGQGQNRTLLFGSELKALQAHPQFERQISREAVASFFQRLAVPQEMSVFQGISKLQPGTILRFGTQDKTPHVTCYWSLQDEVARGAANRFEGDEAEMLLQTENVLSRAVQRQMISDVPLGAFLSGGIDSSMVTALMQKHSARPVKTFSIGFAEEEFDESRYSEDVAQHLGTDHTVLHLTPDDTMGVVPKISDLYDEPFADISQIPTFIVSKLARESVTVCLSGDGADEMFGGYTRYGRALKAWGMRNKLPGGVWRGLAPVARSLSSRLPGRAGRAARAAGIFDSPTLEQFYARMTDYSRDVTLVLNSDTRPNKFNLAAQSPLERLMEYDLGGYLVDDILVKVDRAAMANSLETRAPFLDHTVAEFAFSLPSETKQRVRDGKVDTKWPVRGVLYKHVPQALLDRPKKGFGVPIAEWLRGPLHNWAADWIASDVLAQDDLLNVPRIRQIWDLHQKGQADYSSQIWAVLVFAAWRDRWMSQLEVSKTESINR